MGLDPGATGCADDATNNEVDYAGYTASGTDTLYVANRWSNNCQANWTRSWVGASCCPDEINSYVQYGCCWGNNYYDSGYYTVDWTNMLDGAAGTPCTWSQTTGEWTTATQCY